MEFFSGYRHELERRDLILAEAEPAEIVMQSVGDSVPDDFDHYWQKIENQRSTNSCVGNAGSSVGECLNKLYNGDETQLSRWFAYIESQRLAGIRGDRGSTIEAMLKAGKQIGFVPESMVPFPSRYHNNIPAEAKSAASDLRWAKWYFARDRKQHAVFTSSGQGACLMGIPWFASFAENRSGMLSSIAGRLLGYHAVYSAGYTTIDGEIYPWLRNSHSEGWGDNGRAAVAPRVWDALLERRDCVFAWVTDLDSPKRRALTWDDSALNPWLRIEQIVGENPVV